MTPDQIRLLQRSLKAIESIDSEVASSFFATLFEIEPSMRVLFSADTSVNWRKFIGVFQRMVRQEQRSFLTVPVTSGQIREVSTPGLTELARRYIDYGAKPEHLIAGRQALMISLELHFGAGFDAATAQAWHAAYDILAGSIMSVMREEAIQVALPDARWRSPSIREGASLEQLFAQ
jgi:methyl-accepting chemotaxis protein